jgi:hypothetical protein
MPEASVGKRWRPFSETSLNDSGKKVMSGCCTERCSETEARKATKTKQAQESIDSPRDVIFPK